MSKKVQDLLRQMQGLPALPFPASVERTRLFDVQFVCNSLRFVYPYLTMENIDQILFSNCFVRIIDIGLQLEIRAYYEAWKRARYYAEAGIRLDVDILRSLHSAMTLIPENKGAYRNEYRDEFLSVGSIAEQLYMLMDKCRNAMRGYSPVARASYLHLAMNTIRPFHGKNKRLTRILVNHELCRGGLPPIVFPHADRVRYIGALEAYRLEGRVHKMKMYMQERVLDALQKEIIQRQSHNAASGKDNHYGSEDK